jgi:hypothetical protein
MRLSRQALIPTRNNYGRDRSRPLLFFLIPDPCSYAFARTSAFRRAFSRLL